MLLLLLFGQTWEHRSSDAPDGARVEVLAQLIRGEGYHLIHGQQTAAGIALAHATLNRGGDLERTARLHYHGYYAEHSGPVIEQDRMVADLALRLYRAGYDTTGGALYVLSLADLEAWGVDPGNTDASLVLCSQEYPDLWALYFYTEGNYPLEGNEDD